MRPPARPWTRFALVQALLLAAALLAGAGAHVPLTRLAVAGFEALADAQYRMHLASRNINADGLAEYAVLVGAGGETELARWARQAEGALRESSIPGWQVVSLPEADAEQRISSLRDAPFARAVLRNRGLWICH